MSELNLNNFLELFPTISEEFLLGIYEAHNDNVTMEELIDVVLSFEFPPPRENHDDGNGPGPFTDDHDKPVNVKSESISTTTNSFDTDPPREDEVLLKSIPEINMNSHSEDIDDSLIKSNNNEFKKSASRENAKIVVNGTGNDKIMINDNRGHNSVKQKVDTDMEMSNDVALQIQNNGIFKPTSELNNCTCTINHEQCNNEDEEGDCSPECSIKYLLEGYNIMPVRELEAVVPEENRNPDSTNNEMSSNLSHITADPISNLTSPNSKVSGTKPKKGCRFQKQNNCSTLSQNDSRPTLSHCQSKTVRSCKIKNEEERLRKRLINQSRLVHERVGNSSKTPLCPSQFQETDKKLALLCNIFPDADSHYLLDQCEFLTDQEKILAFIAEHLEFRDYPKTENANKKSRLIEEFHCTVDKFIEVIPDPVAEFSSNNYIRAGYEENAEVYLTARYEGLSYQEARERLCANDYNMTTVSTQLEEEGRRATVGVLDYTPLHHPANIFFHQEVWYMEHRKEVQDFLESTIEAIRIQEELNRPPSPPVEVFVCQICMEDIEEYWNLGTCDGKDGHLFCLNCIKRSIEVKIGDGETTFPCLINCGAFIPLQTVKELIPKPTFDKLMGKIQEDEIRKANIAGVETCPFCHYAYGPGEEALFICLNADCGKTSCRICRKEDHSPDLCAMFKNEDEERARHIIEERMAEALMRTCYNCGKNFVKSDGCNKMACTCGAKMCYVCRQPVRDYDHFNGQGGEYTDRCPLFSQEHELHVQPVEATAQQVFNEIAANNPQLNLDRAKLIPK